MTNAVVTGATKGIGLAICELLAEKGVNLAICSRNNQELKSLAKRLEKENGIQVYYEQCDVSNKGDIQLFGEHALEELKTIDILVNNAGVFIPGRISDEDETTFEQQLFTNTFSAYYLTKKILPSLRKSVQPHIFNMCSTASIMAYENGGSYSVSKFALYGMTKVLREELKSTNIKVTAIMPGATLTASWEGTDLPKKHFMSSQEIALSLWSAYAMPGQAVVEEILLRPQLGDI